MNSRDDTHAQEDGLGDLPAPGDVDGEVPVAFQIDAKPSDDEDFNWIHTMCETVATGVVLEASPGGHKIVAIFQMYRDFIEENLDSVQGPLDPQRFTNYLEAESESRPPTPDQWVDDMFEALDELFIDAVRDQGMQPEETFEHFDRYVIDLVDWFVEERDVDPALFNRGDGDV
jgi:hypothetical protein